MIPNIIHQIWIQGYEKMPETFKDYQCGCKSINDNFEFMFWDEDKIKELISKEIGDEYLKLYEDSKIFAQKADIARYAILYTHGGIYLDMDMVCRKNLTPFLKYGFFIVPIMFHKYLKRYLNGIFGTRAKHPLFLLIFEEMAKRKDKFNDVTYSTACRLFYDCVLKYIKQNPDHDIVMVDRKYLHPCTPYDGKLCPYTCKDCYIAHTSYSSWIPRLKFFKTGYENLPMVLIIILIIIFTLIFMKHK